MVSDRTELRTRHRGRSRPSERAERGRHRQRLPLPGRVHDRAGRAKDAPADRALRFLSPSGAQLRRRAGIHDRPGRGARRHHPLRHGGGRRRRASAHPLGLGADSQGFWSRGRRALRTRYLSTRLAFGRIPALCPSRVALPSPTRRRIAQAEDPAAMRRELEAQLARTRSPYPAAESFAVHDIIDPRDTRRALSEWVEWIQPALETLKGPTRFTMRP